MESSDNKICNSFEKESLLFIDNDLPKDRIEFWEQHLAGCADCSMYLNDIKSIIKDANEKLVIDISETSLTNLIHTAVSKNKITHFTIKTIFSKSYLLQNSKLRITISAAIIILAFVISFISFSIKTKNVSQSRSDLESVQQQIPLNKMVQIVYGNEMDHQLDLIQKQMNKLNLK